VTVSTTTLKEFNVGQIVTLAYRQGALVGDGQTPSEAQMLVGTDLLALVISGVSAKGYFAKTIEFYNLTLVAGVFQYNLPASVIDVVGNGMYISPGFTNVDQATAETVVLSSTREEWHQTPGKGSLGAPSFYYAHRAQTLVEINMWPVPSATEAGGVVRFQTHRLRADVTDRAATVDVERYWTEWLVYQLAADLSIGAGLPVNRVQMLENKALLKLRDAQSMSKESAPMRVMLSHGTSWSR
jgi:hypothetical protein